MDKIYIFDVDGTLTPSRLPMTKEFQKFFGEWAKTNKFYLVTGSDIAKLQEQMCMYDIEAEAIFTCCGNEMWIPDPHIVNISAEQVYHNDFKPPETLLTYLGFQVKLSDTPVQSTNHREDRGSMLNFSVVGRDCSDEQREDYFQYDLQSKEREIISGLINEDWVDIEAVIGGQISIDIAPRGNNKSQILYHIITEHPDQKYFFIGDRTMKGGNDYPLAKIMNDRDNCYVFQAGKPSDKFGYRHTEKILQNILND